MDLKGARIGYVPISLSLNGPGDRRRFCYYAKKRNIKFEIADPRQVYDLVVLTQRADLSVWSKYRQGKTRIVYDFIDSYLAIPRHDIKGIFRGTAKFIARQSRYFQFDYWKAIEGMCRRADAVVCSTQEQKKDILRFCSHVYRILDFHSSVVRHVKRDYAASDVFKFVWEGLPTNLGSFYAIKDVLASLKSKRKIELHMVTDLEYYRYLARYGRQHTEVLARQLFDDVHLHAWDEETCAGIITSCDLALIPISLNDPFAMGKPENKLLLLWRMGMPVVVSATPAYTRAMQACGLSMACRSKEEWLATLTRYMNDSDARRLAGESGRRFVEEQYSDEKILECWDRVFDSI